MHDIERRRSSGPFAAGIAAFARDVELVSIRTFVPASLVLVVLGFVPVHQRHRGL